MVERVSTVRQNVSTVLVGCNLPNGLLLQLFQMNDASEMTPQGPRGTKVAVRRGDPIKLNGVSRRFGAEVEYQIIQGYAVTAVPKEFWDQWCDQQHDSAAIGNRCLIAAVDLSDLQAKIREARQDKVKSGFERVDPKNPPSVGGGLKIEPAVSLT